RVALPLLGVVRHRRRAAYRTQRRKRCLSPPNDTRSVPLEGEITFEGSFEEHETAPPPTSARPARGASGASRMFDTIAEAFRHGGFWMIPIACFQGVSFAIMAERIFVVFFKTRL